MFVRSDGCTLQLEQRSRDALPRYHLPLAAPGRASASGETRCTCPVMIGAAPDARRVTYARSRSLTLSKCACAKGVSEFGRVSELQILRVYDKRLVQAMFFACVTRQSPTRSEVSLRPGQPSFALCFGINSFCTGCFKSTFWLTELPS
ncbi:hypothetical protein RRG08_059152 [Elysia crispata]|uniref:Uncharacterized protein n=1 Tax=Elysia crispata TaxID=231223 RepID=A0AAE0ZVU6_9GAST|nr:hypothetical protein RRG08_059152 [Elysia crispata]